MTQKQTEMIAALEQELHDLAPLVRQSFATLGEPSPAVEAQIRQEAQRLLATPRRRLAPWFKARAIIMAASLTLFLGGTVALWVHHHAPATSGWAALGDAENTANLAQLLLDIQGQTDDAYLRAEEEEVLWL